MEGILPALSCAAKDCRLIRVEQRRLRESRALSSPTFVNDSTGVNISVSGLNLTCSVDVAEVTGGRHTRRLSREGLALHWVLRESSRASWRRT